ncbi:MAG: hypothetical protein Q8L14_17240 [Myxococcales bacterium]|nr:hypothetical protein [Myxococcales bacterium]
MTEVTSVAGAALSSQGVAGGAVAAIAHRMGSARIRLEGRLEQVEAAVATVKSVRASLRGGFPGLLPRLPELLRSLEDHLPHVRRHRGSKEVQAALRALRLETEGLVAAARRTAEAIGVPLPRSVHEVCRVLTPHLPVTMNSRVIAKPYELVLLVWLSVVGGAALATGGGPAVPLIFVFWGAQVAFLLGRSVRVVLTARVLRLGAREFPLADLRAVHVELPGWTSGRGARATVALETQCGLRTTIKMPNALGPFIKALRESGVHVTQTGGLW